MTKRKTTRFPILDDRCKKILISLIIIGENIRFNRLHDFLLKNGLELSKPTLSQHLKHLTQEKMVIRKVEDAQNVSYEVNHERFRDLEEYMRSTRERAAKFQRFMVEEERAFDSASLDEQINKVVGTMILRNLRQLKAQIELKSNPVRNWEKSMELWLLASPLYMHYEEWLIEKCIRDKDYREKILQKIDESTKEIKYLP